MRKEGRLNEDKVNEGEEDEKVDEEADDKKDDEEPQPDIVEDDCFEYKLVGVNMHSGTANAGHYWSYINTVRGFEEHAGDDQRWADTEGD